MICRTKLEKSEKTDKETIKLRLQQVKADQKTEKPEHWALVHGGLVTALVEAGAMSVEDNLGAVSGAALHLPPGNISGGGLGGGVIGNDLSWDYTSTSHWQQQPPALLLWWEWPPAATTSGAPLPAASASGVPLPADASGNVPHLSTATGGAPLQHLGWSASRESSPTPSSLGSVEFDMSFRDTSIEIP